MTSYAPIFLIREGLIMSKIDVKSYQSSISKEFIVLKDRVRSLIGNQHWGEEGRYKEIILMNFLRKHLPQNMSVGTGFIMNGGDYDKISSQIDIIVYDDTYPVIFKENDFVIVHAKSVLGIIEVKSRFNKHNFEQVIKKASENALFISPINGKGVFNGVFYYVGGFGVEPTVIVKGFTKLQAFFNLQSF